MGYFDGNTVTAFWNYAQNFAMSDNAWTDTFGPSTPGALDMIAGQTNGAVIIRSAPTANDSSRWPGRPDADRTIPIPRRRPARARRAQVMMTGKNIGDLLNAAEYPLGLVHGWLQPATHQQQRHDRLRAQHLSSVLSGRHSGLHPAPHLVPVLRIDGQSDPCPSDFDARRSATPMCRAARRSIRPTMPTTSKTSIAAVRAGNFPAVSFIKMPAFQDGHPGNSNPLDEQTGLVNLINFLQQQPEWKDHRRDRRPMTTPTAGTTTPSPRRPRHPRSRPPMR